MTVRSFLLVMPFVGASGQSFASMILNGRRAFWSLSTSSGYGMWCEGMRRSFIFLYSSPAAIA